MVSLTAIGEATFALDGRLKTAGVRSAVEMRIAMFVQRIPNVIQTAWRMHGEMRENGAKTILYLVDSVCR